MCDGMPSEARVNELIAAHAGLTWVHPWQRSPLLKYQLRKTETYVLAAGENNAVGMAFDGMHIWVGLDTSPAKVVKMNPADGTYVTYTLAAGENYAFSMAFDGMHMWVGLYTTPAKVRRITKT